MKTIDKIINILVENKKAHFAVFLVILILLSFYLMIAHSPYMTGHDFFHHWSRLNGLIISLKDGTYPWYINYNGLNGAGYFVKAFYGDLTLLPFAVIGLFTSPLTAYHSMLVGTSILCGLVTYWSVYRIYGKITIASIASIAYTFSVYRIFDAYFRSAIGEVFAFIFLPIMLWGLYEIIKRDYKKWYILAVGYSLLIFSHLITSAIAVVPILLILAANYKSLIKEPKRILYLGIAAIGTILLSSHYIFPLLEQLSSNFFYYEAVERGSVMETVTGVMKLSEVIDSFFQGTVYHEHHYFFKIGIILTFLISTRVFVPKRTNAVKSADILAIVGLIIVLMTTDKIPWDTFPFTLLSFMQFTFRFFTFPSLFFAIAGAIYISSMNLTNRKIFYVTIGLTICTTIAIRNMGQNYTFTFFKAFGDPDQFKNLTMENTDHYSYSRCEYLPNAVPSISFLINHSRVVGSQKEDTKINNFENNRGVISFDIETTQDTVELPIVYYKGYEAWINNETELSIEQSKNGLIELPINQSGTVTVYYAGTLIQKLSTVLNILALFALCILIYMNKRKRNE